jgi:hypothetical protein
LRLLSTLTTLNYQYHGRDTWVVDACFAVLGLQIQKEMETEILNVSGSRISHRLTQISQASKEFLKMSKEPERTGKNRKEPERTGIFLLNLRESRHNFRRTSTATTSTFTSGPYRLNFY